MSSGLWTYGDGIPDAFFPHVWILPILLLTAACATFAPPRAYGPPPLPPLSEPATADRDALASESTDGSAMALPATTAPPHSTNVVQAAEASTAMPTPLDGLGTNVLDAFWGYNLLYYAGAVTVTGVMVASGADRSIHDEFDGPSTSKPWNDVANIAGYVVPGLTAPTLWIAGLALHDRTLAGAGSAAIQALAVTMAATGALKVATGRAFPLEDEPFPTADHAREFHPLQNGIGSWPSGHSAGTISIAAALTAYAPEQAWIPWVAYPVAITITVGMIDRDSHWTSDSISGVLIGQAIGYSIGRNFRLRVRGGSTAETVELVPLTGGQGLALAGRW